MFPFPKRIAFSAWLLGLSAILSACTASRAASPIPQPTQHVEKKNTPSTNPGTPAAEDADALEERLELLPEEEPPIGASSEFATDFSKHIVPFNEILSGGPPKDGIPAIDNPKFVNVIEADEWLEDLEPVILFQKGEETRAYPLQILTWHEIVNDTVAGQPVVVTFCPLCNTGIAFDRTVGSQVLDFGTTGRLRYSNLIMYDRQTETWWQQASGKAIAGELTGTQLAFLPAAMISWAEFKASFPDGQVLSRETGFVRSYGRNPYGGYDDINSSPFLYRGPRTPEALPAMARVLTVDLAGEAVAFPYDLLQEVHVVNETVGDTDLVVIWEQGTASALDAGTLAEGRDVGTANAYSRKLDGQMLTFVYDGGRILDEQTGSQWDVLGRALGGQLAGEQLEAVVAINHFWFSWAAFKPETRIYQP